MKLATLNFDGETILAIVSPVDGKFWPIEAGLLSPRYDMICLIERFDEIVGALQATGDGFPLAAASVQAPLVPSRNVMCVGKNYAQHALEFAKSGFDSSISSSSDAIPSAPIIFTKAPDTIIGCGHPIQYPHGVSQCVDYEAELAVVIGRGGKGISREAALSHVFGYTIVNDVTARDLQSRYKQWFVGKSLDTFCPLGPWLVTSDEVDVTSLQIRCWVNDELRQDANTRDLVFDLPTLIETISAGITLKPGDVIATGTPAGVGVGFDPPRYLAVGDVVKIEISGLGCLTNEIV